MSLRPDNKYEIVRKSIYHRKYYLDEVIFNLTKKYNMYITVNDNNKIITVFEKIKQCITTDPW